MNGTAPPTAIPEVTGTHPYADKFPMLSDPELAHQGVSSDRQVAVWITPSDITRGYFKIAVLNRGDAFSSAFDVAGSRVKWWLETNRVPLTLDWASKPYEPAPVRAEGNVYFIRDEDGFIKIGYARNVGARLDTLQTASRQQLTLIASMPGTPDGEKALHARFATDRVRGEWFRPGRELRDYIAEVAT